MEVGRGPFSLLLICITISWVCILCSLDSGIEDKDEIVDPDLKLSDIVFIVLSQPNTYHSKRADRFASHVNGQLKNVDWKEQPKIYMSHKKWPQYIGNYAIFPMLPRWADEFKDKSWIFLCEEETRLNLKKLLKVLQKYDHKKEWFLGKGLYDSKGVIIHHYAFHDNPGKFLYPDIGAGVLFSQPLIKRIGRKWPMEDFRSDFVIDPKHEIAMYVNFGENGTLLKNVPELCTFKKEKSCATWYPRQFPDCGKAIPKKHLFVAVKTCEKFHKDRVKIVKETWGKDTKHIEYYSDVEDPSIPTINLGVKNTERGHCGKTMAIIKRYLKEYMDSYRWLLITDDDTVINLKRLRKLLACYDPLEIIHLGEKYGYMVTKNNHGYSYITGGGGMIFSGMAVEALVKRGKAECPTDDSPDDMILGRSFKHLDVPLVHCQYLHQARPDDYSQEFLKARTAISFHKHTHTDPYQVYRDLMTKTEAEEAETEKYKQEKNKKTQAKTQSQDNADNSNEQSDNTHHEEL